MKQHIKFNPFIFSVTLFSILVSSIFNLFSQTPAFLKDYQLVWSDEFNGTKLNTDVWRHEETQINKPRNTYRGLENAIVTNGELRLYVTKVEREGMAWTAASIYRIEPIEQGAYVETRFKPTTSPGINNAFWLSSRPVDSKQYISNRYEIDIVETRFSVKENHGSAHLAWHDWKGQGYIKNKKGAADHIAQGIHIEHDWSDYQNWGFKIENNNMEWFLNGEKKWEGITHENPNYLEQHKTGLGKFDTWFTNNENKVYAKNGQEEWHFYKGYSGDNLNIILSTLPWGESWTPFDETTANGTYMAIDYVRVYMPKRLLNTNALFTLAVKDLKTVLPAPQKPAPYKYFSITGTSETLLSENLSVTFAGKKGAPIFNCGLKAGNLFIKPGKNEITSASVAFSDWNTYKQTLKKGVTYNFIVRLEKNDQYPTETLVAIMLIEKGDKMFITAV